MPVLSSRCFSIPPRIIFSMILQGTEVRLTGLQLPGSTFLPFLKIVSVCPHPVNRHLSRFPKLFKNHWERSFSDSARSLSTLAWIQSGPIDLQRSSWRSKSHRFRVDWVFTILAVMVLLLEDPPNLSSVLMTEANKGLNISALCPCFWDEHPHQVKGQCFFWSAFCYQYILKMLSQISGLLNSSFSLPSFCSPSGLNFHNLTTFDFNS